jgi:uncharacterized phage protein gp47/JayE
VSGSINPLDYGVLVTGFSRMRLPEIRQAIIDTLQQKTELVFETRPDSITGQFIDVFAEREATVWELAEAVYHAMYPTSAYGVNLDYAVSFTGVKRLFASKSIAWVNYYGVEGTIIPIGTLLRSNNDNMNYLNQLPVTISKSAIGEVTVSIDTAVVGATYWIRIDAYTANYIVILGDTNLIVAQNLAADLQTGSDHIVTLTDNVINIQNVEGINFNFATSTNVTVVEFGTIAQVIAEDYGPADISANSITQIVTTQFGLDRVNNPTPGQAGRNTETDDELRLRYDRGVYRLGAATIDSIWANLQQNIIGLINVTVYENNDDFVDVDGRPPHCIEVVAYGGDAQDIANEIWRLKPAGIETFGNTEVTVTDSANYSHIMRFSRPELVYVWINVRVGLYNEEIFPPAGDNMIAQIISDTGNSFGVGKDVIVQRFHGPVYSQVSGIGSMVISCYATSDPDYTPQDTDYTLGNYPISVRQLSIFAVERVLVIVDVPSI